MARRRKQDDEKLRLWQQRFRVCLAAAQEERSRMDRREQFYAGEIDDAGTDEVSGEKRTAPRVRNVCAEMIESQVSADVPMPKVTALEEQDEWLAGIIEDMLRDDIRRLRAQTMTDLMQRTVPIQGGGYWLTDWDNAIRNHDTIGETDLRPIHPKPLIPQVGVTELEDMDYFFLEIPQTKKSIRVRYGVDVSREAEEDPDIRGSGYEDRGADDMVTQIVAFFKGPGGAVGRFSWVGDVVLEDNPDYLARRMRVCARCGEPEPELDIEPVEQTLDGSRPGGGPELPDDFEEPKPRARHGTGRGECPYCGSRKWEEQEQEFEEFWIPMTVYRPDGTPMLQIPGAEEVWETDAETGEEIFTGRREPTRVPYYKPKEYPVVLQRNISRYGQLLGASDIDALEPDQIALNHLEWKMHEKLNTGGSYLILPATATIAVNDQQLKTIVLESPAEAAMIRVETVEADISQDMARAADIYEQVKQRIGVTDSFLGRKDPTATSGKAKEFAAAQTAGRQMSKGTMRDAAWAEIYKRMFHLKLAFADEPRRVAGDDGNGKRTYREFNRYLFLRQDEAGNWYWNDRFLFEVDAAAPLATNRDAMVAQMTEHFRAGSFGDPTAIDTLILYWTQMGKLHYPMAEDIVDFLKELKQQQLQAAAMQQQIVVQQDNNMTINQPPMEAGTPQRVT